MIRYAATSLAALALAGAASVYADPQPEPLYVHCEQEGNDLCYDEETFADLSESFSVPGQFRECFYISGKLQKDCVWDRVPKCHLAAYGKPQVCFDEDGDPLPGAFEPIYASTSAGHLNLVRLVPDSGGDLGTPNTSSTLRLGVGVTQDVFADGTLNGLVFNNCHEEYGKVVVKIFGPSVLPDPRGPDGMPERPPVFSHCFDFRGGDALRVAFCFPEGTANGQVEVWCCEDLGTKEVCYDVDFYTVRGLLPDETYCVSVVGGVDYWCNKTDTNIIGYQKGWTPIFAPGSTGNDDNPDISPASAQVYSEWCTESSGEFTPTRGFVFEGVIRFAVTGTGDNNANGLCDADEDDYLDFLDFLAEEADDGNLDIPGKKFYADDFKFVPGASAECCDCDTFFPTPAFRAGDSSQTGINPKDVVRIPNHDDIDDSELDNLFDSNPEFQCPPGHGICGGYCIKIRRANHIDEDPMTTAQRADFDNSARINSQDLSMLLSVWGPVPEGL